MVMLLFRKSRCGELTVYSYVYPEGTGKNRVCYSIALAGSVLFGTRLPEAVGVCVDGKRVIYKEYKPSVTGPFSASVLVETAGSE